MLQQIYSGLHSADYSVGAAAVRDDVATLEERISLYRATGNFQDALGCYEGLIKSGIDSTNAFCGMVECYLRLDRPHTAASLVEGRFCKEQEENNMDKDKLRALQVSLDIL